VGADEFFNSVAARAHHNNSGFIVLGSDVLHWLVVTSCEFSESLHHVSKLAWKFSKVLVGSFDGLPCKLWWHNGTTLGWVLWVHGTGTDAADGFFINKLVEIGVGNFLVGVDFVGGTETIKEVDEWDSGLDHSKVSNGGKILGFLDSVGAKEWHASGTSGIDITVIVVDGEGSKSEGTSCNVDNGWAVFGGDLVEVWDHKKETLRCGKGGAKGTS